MRLAHYLPLLAAGLALLLPAPAFGQVVWNTTTGNYGHGPNWLPVGVPTAGDNVRFNTGGGAAYTVNVNGTFESANLESNDTDVTLSLLGNDYTVTNTVEVLDQGFGGKLTIVNGRMFSATTLIGDSDSGGGLFIHGSAEYQTGFLQTGPFGSATLAVGTAVSPGTLTTNNARIESTAASVVGVGSRWHSGAGLTVGRNSTGSLLVDDEAIVTSSGGTILLGEIAGEGFVTVSNLGRIEGFSGFDVGVGARGTLDILSGGSVVGDTLRVAVSPGSAGSTVTVDGASTLSVAVLTVGEGSQGALTVSNGAILSTGVTNLGWSPGSLGTVEVNTGGQWFASDDIFVGVSGQGGLTLRAASTLAGVNLVIAEQENSVGTANLAGAASFTGGVFVGPGGDGELTVSSSLQTGAASAIGGRLDGQTGTVTIDGPGVWTMTGGPLVIHNYGELDVRAGSILNTVGAEMGVRMFGDAVAVETAAATVSGTWNSGGLLLVGATADALLVVNSGGLLFSQDTRVADVYDLDLVHVDAIVTLQGGSWNNTGTLHVGDGGSGSVNVFADSLLTTSVTTLGSTVTDGSPSHGIVNISGGNAVWNSNGLLQVGTLGVGQVLISNQGAVHASEVRISDGLASLGSIEIDGAGSLLTLSGALVVGANGAGVLSITNGGELQTAAGAAIGNHDALVSSVEVTGGEWGNTGQLVVGNQGLGRLTITSGTVQTGTLTAGAAIDAVGDLEVSGELSVNGSLTLGAMGQGHLSVDGVVDVAGALRVGQSGSGSVSVQSGGEVNSLGGILGSSAGARASVEVQGAGSHWDASGAALIVGDQGEAVVEVYDGGQWTTSDLRIANFHRGDVLLEEAVAASSSLEMAQVGAAQTDLAVFYRTPQHLGFVFDEDNYAGPPAPSAHTAGSFATALAVGSSWSIGGEVTVAVEGLALLGVVGGSTLQTGETILAEELGSFAHVLVQQSAWSIAGALEVGAGGGEGHLTIDNGLVSATGEITLASGSTVNLSSGVLQGSIITIEVGATLQGHGVLVADAIIGTVGAPTEAVEFDGNLTIGATQTALVSSDGTATFNGTIHLNGGTLAAPDGIIIGDTGVLTGVGLIEADIQADGLVSIGSSPGTLDVDGDYTQTDDATLLIELEGTANSEFDRLLATGDVQLDGDLQVMLLNGYEPQFTDVFTIITGDSITGAFDNAPGNLVSFAGGIFQVSYGANSVQLGNFTPVPVPEPGVGLLLALAGGALLARRRLRSRAG